MLSAINKHRRRLPEHLDRSVGAEKDFWLLFSGTLNSQLDSSLPLLLSSGRVTRSRPLAPPWVVDAEDRDWGTWRYFNSLHTRRQPDSPEAGRGKEADGANAGHIEVLVDTGASSSKDQLDALFQNKKNQLPYFIILYGLSIDSQPGKYALCFCLPELEEFCAD